MKPHVLLWTMVEDTVKIRVGAGRKVWLQRSEGICVPSSTAPCWAELSLASCCLRPSAILLQLVRATSSGWG